MKHFLLPFFALFFCATQSNAQSLVPFPETGFVEGEIHHGDWTNPVDIDYSVVYLSDTVMGGITYSRFSRATGSYGFYTTYDNGLVTHYYRNFDGSASGGTPLYDFSLNVGDSFDVAMGFTYGTLVVDSIATVTLLNNEQRKYMHLTNTNGWVTDFEWIDGIGDINRGLTYISDFEGGFEEFLCAGSAAGDLWETSNVSLNYDCDSLLATSGVSIGIENVNEALKFSVHPVPNNGQFTVELAEQSNSVIRIYSVSGQLLYTFNHTQSTVNLNINDLDAGIYLITVETDKAIGTRKLVVE